MDNKIKSFLWVVPAWPFPPEDGAAIARANLIKGLITCGFAIDILVISNSPQIHFNIPDDIAIRTVYTIQTRSELNKFLKPFYYILASIIHFWTPVVMVRFSRKHIRLAIQNILAENPSLWDAIVYDGLHVAAHQMHFGLYQRNNYPKMIIYRAHNVESDIWIRMANQQKNPLKSFFLHTQAKRIVKFEKSLLEAADKVAAVSETDFSRFKDLVPSIKGNIVPISFDFHLPLPFPGLNEDKLDIMFLGKMDWQPNKDGLIWFLTKVWLPVIEKRKNIHLYIAGSGNSTWLQKFSNLPNISLLGKIPDVEQLYKKSSLLLVPIFYGSGTRVKIIEACCYARPCLSTSLGAEGIGLEDQKSYYCAEDAESWIRCLSTVQLSDLNTMGKNAYLVAKNQFDHTIAKNAFISLLKSP